MNKIKNGSGEVTTDATKYIRNSKNSVSKKQTIRFKNGQTFFQGRQTGGQQTHKKMLNITNYQENVNQNHNEISPHTCQNGYHPKNEVTINAGEGVEKREPSCTVGGNV